MDKELINKKIMWARIRRDYIGLPLTVISVVMFAYMLMVPVPAMAIFWLFMIPLNFFTVYINDKLIHFLQRYLNSMDGDDRKKKIDALYGR